jgi:hypothetical protein
MCGSDQVCQLYRTWQFKGNEVAQLQTHCAATTTAVNTYLKITNDDI